MDKKRRQEFWMQTMSASLGTIVGIILTFGTTLLLQNCEQRRMERKEALWVIYDIDGFCKVLETDIKNFESANSLNEYVWEHRDSIDQIPNDSLNRFVGNLSSVAYLDYDNTVENIFASNIDTWKNIGNQDFISLAGYCFSLKKEMREMYSQITKKEYRLYSTLRVIDHYSYDHAQSKHEFIERILQSEEVQHFFGDVDRFIDIMKITLAAMKEKNAKNKELMHVTDEELAKYFGDDSGALSCHAFSQEEEEKRKAKQ